MKKNNYTGYSLTCQICRADNLKNILNLGHQPIVQEYLRAEELHESETRYPLNLVRCSNCSLVQIDYVPEPGKVFFPDYPYRTGRSEEHTSELQSQSNLVCRLLLEKKKKSKLYAQPRPLHSCPIRHSSQPDRR